MRSDAIPTIPGRDDRTPAFTATARRLLARPQLRRALASAALLAAAWCAGTDSARAGEGDGAPSLPAPVEQAVDQATPPAVGLDGTIAQTADAAAAATEPVATGVSEELGPAIAPVSDRAPEPAGSLIEPIPGLDPILETDPAISRPPPPALQRTRTAAPPPDASRGDVEPAARPTAPRLIDAAPATTLDPELAAPLPPPVDAVDGPRPAASSTDAPGRAASAHAAPGVTRPAMDAGDASAFGEAGGGTAAVGMLTSLLLIVALSWSVLGTGARCELSTPQLVPVPPG